MPRYRPSDLKRYLSSLGVTPKKQLSQNFLIDGNILDKIVRLGNIDEKDVVIEIGAGPGALTEKLLEKGAHVIAIEKDKVLAKGLEGFSSKELDILAKDVLRVSFKELAKQYLKPTQKLKVIANIPYKITAPIIEKIIQSRSDIECVILMVQEEVGRRCVAKKGGKDFGHFSLFVQFYTTPSFCFPVAPSCFYPKPKVHSCVIALHPKKQLPDIDPEFFFSITRAAFSQRRKMIRASLQEHYPKQLIEELFVELGYSPTARPENLCLEEWVAFCKVLKECTIP